jgi:DNA-binding SARP family transcriptional activator
MLGSFRVLREGELIALGGPKQRAVLAMLVLEAPRTVTVDRLADAIWGSAAPARVETSLQSYVSNLRRALGDDAPLLTTRPGGWALDVEPDRVDAARFERLVATGQAARGAGRPAEAVAQLADALAMWEPPLPEYAGEHWVREVVVRLEARHAVALEEWLAARLDLGEHVAALPDIEAAVASEPLSEQLRAHLALAHYRAGNQTEALRSLARAREVLADEVGVEPGPELRRLEAQILAHAPELDWRPPARDQPDMRTLGLDPLIGRAAERTTLAALVADARNGRFRCVAIDGDPGAGKSRLLEELELLGVEAGAAVVWGRCYEGTGAPALWPWLQVVQAMVDDGSVRPAIAAELESILNRATQLGAPGPDNGRFRLFEAITAAIVDRAGQHPLVLVIDDLQWADQGSLDLLGHIAARLATAPVVLAVAVRRAEAAADPALGAALGALARTPGAQRIALTGLRPADTARLVEQVTGIVPTPATARSIADRTDGNPFFVRELARLLLHERQPLDSTPLGVRDVVRRRLDGLDERSRELLLAAAVIGREVDLTILATATGTSLLDCLEAIEPAITAGVLDADSLASARFSHDIVREAILAASSAVRRARLHLAVAEALERAEESGADRAEQIAHHMSAAGPLVPGDRLAAALEAGAVAAERRYGYESAVRLQRQAFELRRRANDREAELAAGVQLAALVGGVTGYAEVETSLMDRIDELAAELGRTDLTIFLRWSRWAAVDQAGDLETSRKLASELRDLAEHSDDPLVRQYGRQAWAIYCWHTGRIAEAVAAFTAALPDIEHVLDELLHEEANAMVITSIIIGLGFAAGITEITGDRERAYELYDLTERRTGGYGPLAHVTRAMFGSVSAAYAGDAPRVLELTNRAIELDADGTMAFMSFFNRIMNAWARSQVGDAQEAIADFDVALATFLASNARTGHAMWKAFHAEALLAAGRLDDAAAAVAEGLDIAMSRGELQGLPLGLLVRAEVAAARGAPPEETAAALAEASRVAEEQGAVVLVERIRRMSADLPVG